MSRTWMQTGACLATVLLGCVGQITSRNVALRTDGDGGRSGVDGGTQADSDSGQRFVVKADTGVNIDTGAPDGSPHVNPSTDGAVAVGSPDASPPSVVDSGSGKVDMGTPPTPVVGSCNDLGGVDEFQNITPPGVTSVLQVLVDDVNSGTIYAGTQMQGIYKSTDCGANWAKVNTGKGAAIVDSGLQWSMAIDPVYPNVLYAGNLYATDTSLFKSTNGGVDWVSLFPDGSEIANTVAYKFVQEVAIDPSKDRNGHLVVSFHSDCSGAYAPMCMAESLDGGAHWRLFKGPTPGWTENARPIILDAKTFIYETWSDGVFYTQDSGATWTQGGQGGNHQMYKTPAGVFYLGSAYGMQRSSDGLKWTQIANTPKGDGLASDGVRMFTSLRDSDSNQQPYFVSAVTDGSTWKSFSSPAMAHGGVILRVDAGHNLLYSANTASGLWRMRTK